MNKDLKSTTLPLRGVQNKLPRDNSSTFYKSSEWKNARRQIIENDLGLDLEVDCNAYEIKETLSVAETVRLLT